MRAAALCLILAAPAAADSSSAGVAFGEGLRLAQTARAQGMGEAITAAADGVTALGVNPAGVLATGIATFHLTHTLHVEGFGEDYFAYAQRLPPASGVGVSLYALHAGSLTRQAEDAAGNWAGEAGTYPSLLLAGSVAWAIDLRAVLPGLDALRPTGGAALRVVSQQVDKDRWVGMDADVGATVRPGGGFAFAAVLQHLGAGQDGLGMPAQFVFGSSWQRDRLVGQADSWLVEADLPVAGDRSFPLRAGTEYRIATGGFGFAVRAGWRRELADTGAAGISAGVGFRRLTGRFPFGFDYAFVPFGDLGTRHAIALTFGLQPAPVAEPGAGTAPEAAPARRVFSPALGERFRQDVRLREAADVTVKLLDDGGRELRVLEPARRREKGTIVVTWDGRLEEGAPAPRDRAYTVAVQAGSQMYYFEVFLRAE